LILAVIDGLTFTLKLASDTQPVLPLVNVNVALPPLIPVTKPLFVTDATLVLLLVHVPPVLGLNVVVPPIHIFLVPDTKAIGFAFTVTTLVASLGHKVVLLVNVNVAVPAAIPVTTPAFVTVATDVLLLAHVPPVVGLKTVVLPIHIEFDPVMFTDGFTFTVNGAVANEVHPELVRV
jgi:hypothetical protein